MRQYLFVDNFRGFTNTQVPIVDVNFLVGENSTGKTSLLSLLRLFSSPYIFMGSEFHGESDIQFGPFNEMVSVHAEDRSYFRIGFIAERIPIEKNDPNWVNGLLLTYIDHAGLPQISGITCVVGKTEIYLRWQDGRILFKFKQLGDITTADDMTRLIPVWIADHAGVGVELTELSLPDNLKTEGIPLFMITSMAAQVAAKTQAGPSKDASSFPFFMPFFGPPLVWIAPIRTKPRRTYDDPQTAFSSEGCKRQRKPSVPSMNLVMK
jgi:hypothetical protein